MKAQIYMFKRFQTKSKNHNKEEMTYSLQCVDFLVVFHTTQTLKPFNCKATVYRDQTLLVSLQFSCGVTNQEQLLHIGLDSRDGGVAAHHVLDGFVLEFAAIYEGLFAVHIIWLKEILTILC